MDQLRKWRAFSESVLKGERVPENTLCIELQRYANMFYVWYNFDEFKKLPVTKKIIHVLVMVGSFVYWMLVGVKVSELPLVKENIGIICKPMSMVLGGCISAVRCIEAWRHREATTCILETINRKTNLARKTALPERLQENLKLHIYLSWSIITAITFLALMFIVLTTYTINTADFELEIYVPYDVAAYSATWWAEVAYNGVITIYCSIMYTILEGISMDTIIQLTFLHRVQYDRLTTISGSDAEVKQTFISIYQELKELKS